MVLYPLAAAFILIWLVLTLRNSDNGLVVVIAVIPFGMFAALVAGGLSILLAPLLAVFTIGVLLIRLVSLRSRAPAVWFPKSALYLSLFAVYSVFSAFILVRLFQGQFLVFPVSVTLKGTMISAFYPSTMVPLRPGNSNISQSFYILLSAMFFVAGVLVMRRRGISFGEKGLIWAASINVVLGLLDLMQLDTLLQFIRTADYTLNNHHMVGSLPRVIGGYAEASAFGAVSATFFAYFAMSFLIGKRRRDGTLAGLNLFFAMMSLSSTAMLSVAAAVCLILLHTSVFVKSRMSRQAAQYGIVAMAFVVIAACLLLLMTPADVFVAKTLDTLIFSKDTSLSGMERAAWAENGINAFLQTWGLGAGAGSLRANGLIAVLLGSVGVPGTLAFALFLLHGIGKALPPGSNTLARPFYAGRVAALTVLASMMVSATVPDPTLLLMVLVAVSVVAHDKAASQSAQTGFLRKLSAQQG